MKGFKKDGKFRPTEKRNKSGITKKSFEDVHAEHMINQANAQKILLRHKENLKSDMQECTLCDQQFDKNDPLFDIRISRHVLGMHSKNRTIYSERTGSPSTPMGNHTYGDAKFVPEKEKRNKESIDVCEPATEIGNRGLNCKTTKEGYELDREREEHFRTCNHPNCKETYKLREEMGSNNQTFEQFEEHADADEFRHAFTEEES